MFKKATTGSVKMCESGDNAPPYVLRVMKCCKILEMLTTLAINIQVFIGEHSACKSFEIL